MTPQLLRLAYTLEFLVALVAIFTAWSEVGGQAVLDLMHWAWKLSLSLVLATAITGFSVVISTDTKVWTMRSARWFVAVLTCVLAMAAVTYYYSLQVDMSDGEESSAVSAISFSGRSVPQQS